MEIEYREPRVTFIKLGDQTIRRIISYTGTFLFLQYSYIRLSQLIGIYMSIFPSVYSLKSDFQFIRKVTLT